MAFKLQIRHVSLPRSPDSAEMHHFSRFSRRTHQLCALLSEMPTTILRRFFRVETQAKQTEQVGSS